MNSNLLNSIPACGLVVAFGIATFILTSDPGHAALPAGRGLAIETQGTNVSLSWLSITNAPYGVQARTNLVQGDWGLPAPIIGTGEVIGYPVAPSDSPSRFFRVLFPQPVVTAGEPARYAHGTGGSYLYITGEFFYPGDQVRVGGLLASNAVFVTPSLLRVELPPDLAPGRHDVAVLSGHDGAVLAMLHEAVTVVDPLLDPSVLLYGPPEAPLASPSALWLSKRGYDYYKAQSGLTAAGAHTNPFFNENDLQGNMPTRSEAFLSKKGYDYYQAPSVLNFEVQEGKKGLNAVNVKLARMAGGGGGYPGGDNTGSALAKKGAHVAANRGDRDSREGVVLAACSGEVQACAVDLAIPGRGLDFIWARTYHSRIGRTGASTNGWTFSYDLHL